jgi:hypothetical protein
MEQAKRVELNPPSQPSSLLEFAIEARNKGEADFTDEELMTHVILIIYIIV